MAYVGRLRLNGVPFSSFKVVISLVEVYKRAGKSVILVGKKAQKG